MKIEWKKIGFNLLYPHLAVIICLLPVSIAFLVLSLIYLSSTSFIAKITLNINEEYKDTFILKWTSENHFFIYLFSFFIVLKNSIILGILKHITSKT